MNNLPVSPFQTINPLASVIDAIQWAVEMKILMDTQAIELVSSAVRAGLHTVSASFSTFDPTTR